MEQPKQAAGWHDPIDAKWQFGRATANAGSKIDRHVQQRKPTMTFAVTTHLNFRGQARAALDFYKDVFGGEQVVMTYGSMGQENTAASPDHVMWGQVASKDGFRIMAFDVQAGRTYDAGVNAFFVSLRGSSVDEVQQRWSALAEGASIIHKIAPSPWSALYGMLTDRFGVTWIVDLEPGAA